MRLVIGSDHGGFEAKEKLKKFLQGLGHEVTDFGCYSNEAVDYPDIAQLVGEAVARREFDKGVLLDGFGGAVALAANKV
ncbi:MAG: RpiB/LacA/LacB family sugar-phosphate isomerase, partial [Elusimicrobiota bacterium]